MYIYKLEYKYTNDKKFRTVRDHCQYSSKYRGAVNSICNLKCSIPKEILVVFTMDQTMIIILS